MPRTRGFEDRSVGMSSSVFGSLLATTTSVWALGDPRLSSTLATLDDHPADGSAHLLADMYTFVQSSLVFTDSTAHKPSRWVTASTTASGRHWLGSKAASPYRPCSSGGRTYTGPGSWCTRTTSTSGCCVPSRSPPPDRGGRACTQKLPRGRHARPLAFRS